ncbi:restriction endonuclease subunit S [Secundilactobacillus muriivasis]
MKDNQAKYPQLRFKGFTNPWEQRKLGEVGKTQSGIGFPDAEQGGTEGVPFYKVSDMNKPGNEHEMVNANNYVNYEQLSRKKWKIIETVPAVIFAKVGAAIMLNRKRLVTSPFLIDNNTMAYVFDGSWNIDFGKTLFETINLPRYAQVGALPSYNGSDIESIEVTLPNKGEQVKLGAFFKSLDDTITLHQRKLAKLKELKQGYLQKLFPRNGSKFPQLRFSGFADAWEERKLGNLFSVTDTKHATAPTTDKETQFRMIRTSYVRDGRLLVDQTESVTEQTYKQWSERIRLQPGDIVFSREAPIGEVAIIPDNSYHFFLGQRMVALRSTTEVSTDAQFTLATLLAPRFRREVRIRDAASTTVANFGIPDIKKTSIYVPTPTEQNKLGTLIMMISDTIALHQRKLEKLQELKKGYLQKMFC